MTTKIITGKAEIIKSEIDVLITAGATLHFITKLEAGKVLVVYTP